MGSSTTPTSKNQKPPKKKRKPSGAQPEVELLDSVKWNEADGSIGPNLPGGFLSLEEIDESDYGFFDNLVGVPKVVSCEEGGLEEEVQEESGSGEKKSKTRREKQKEKKRKEKQKAKKRKAMEEKSDAPDKDTNGAKSVDVNEDANESDAEGWVEDDSEVDESEFYAWKGLRLHPLLMKSICKLGFKEPTPIQKACIPAAAHQGKDVVGAAETGSGKTLAFGIPILQRLLEEREKDSRLKEEGKAVENMKRKSPLRALIIAPTRELVLQVTDHLKKIATPANIHVVPIVGGMSMEKQLRCLEKGPEIIVGTPGRLWEHMSEGNQHLVQLHLLSFFVLDEADRMIESGHFHELASIIDLLPNGDDTHSAVSGSCNTVPNVQLKKRQTFVFSATVALSDNFRKKLKYKAVKPRSGMANELSSIETLSVRTGMKDNVAVIDLTKSSIVAEKLEESFIECTEENKEAYLYYILSVHGHGRTIVFCTSTAALRRISAFLRILEISCWTLHGGMQQRARLKAIDRFRVNEHAVLVATDVAARGLDIPGVRTVIHFQLPHTADFYIHRSGRTARASADGCCIALISPSDRAKFVSLCKSLSKGHLLQFPLNESYLPEILKRVSLARQIDKISHMNHKENDKKNWVERNAESIGLMIEKSDSDEEVVRNHKMKKICSRQLQKLQQELKTHIAKPLTSKQFSGRFFTGVGVSSLMHQQLEELSKQKQGQMTSTNERRSKLVVIGQDCIEPLQALRSHGHEVNLNSGKQSEMRKLTDQRKRKKKQDKIHQRDERRKKRKMEKEA